MKTISVKARWFLNLAVMLALLLAVLSSSTSAQADNTAQALPFSQDWSNTGLITSNDNWSTDS